MKCFEHSCIIRDLRELVRLLKLYQFDKANVIELYPLENLIGQSKDIFYRYDTRDVHLNISVSGMSAYPVVKKICIVFNSSYTLAKELSEKVDIFTNYSLQIYVQGYEHGDSSHFTHFFCWHLDREPHTHGSYAHPFYHFHAGGHRMQDIDPGAMLIIGSPRIPHPPMDIFLIIHFLIIHFLHAKEYRVQRTILTDESYIAIMRRAQSRILDPYYSILGQSVTNHEVYTRNNLVPLFI